jgi:hypothetical protein
VDALQVATTATFVFGTGDFTIEAWIYSTAFTGGIIFDGRNGVSGVAVVFYITGGVMKYFVNGTDVITSPTALSGNTWHHVALARSSGSTKMFLNGIQTGSTYSDSNNFTLANTTHIGGKDNQSGNTGVLYISNYRLIKGYAAYTGNFLPSLVPVTATVTGTSFIVNGNNSAIYDSTGFHNISTVGTATINTSIVKFGTSSIRATPTTAYLSITTSSNALIQFGTGPFTIEAWIQVLATAGQKVIYDTRNPDTANAGFDFSINASNQMSFGTNAATYIAGSTVLTNGLWYHVAVVRESLTVIKMYLNGNQEGSTYTASGTQNFTNYLTKIGSGVNGNFNGYISDLRVTKLARYTGNFTTATTYSPPI